MLALFCLRLTLGMLACLWLLPARLIQPRFYRTHCLVALGLLCLALAFAPAGSDRLLGAWLTAAIVLAFLASIVWRLNNAPGGHTIILFLVFPVVMSLWDLEPRTGTRISAGPSNAAQIAPLVGGVSSSFL